jgi:hypothetical protein
MLNLPDVFYPQSFALFSLFVIINIGIVFLAEFLGTFMMQLDTKFHMPPYTDSLVTAIKPKDKYRFCAAAILIIYIVQKD